MPADFIRRENKRLTCTSGEDTPDGGCGAGDGFAAETPVGPLPARVAGHLRSAHVCCETGLSAGHVDQVQRAQI